VVEGGNHLLTPQSTACLLAIAAILAGCTAAPLVARKADVSSFKQDHACTQESRVPFGGSGLGLAAAQIDARRESRKLYTLCMEARGYEITEER
jgi:hypothetical protein